MLIVAAELSIEANAVDGVRDALAVMETGSRKESGCGTYVFSIDVNDPCTLRIFERWDSMEALEVHFKTPHMTAFREVLAKVNPKSMDVKVYDVAGELSLPS
jgi:quinol monooxygenase YgiN